jgi:uncharacterized RDD family membrane protein YckC
MVDGLLLMLITAACFVPAIVVLATGDTETVGCVVDADGDRVLDAGDRLPNAICEEPTDGTVLAAAGVGLVGCIPLLLVQVWFYRRLGRTGLSWGRRATGTRLVSADTGLPIGAWQAWGRDLLQSIFLYALAIGHLWMLWDRRKQTWHDKVLSSVVVRTG